MAAAAALPNVALIGAGGVGKALMKTFSAAGVPTVYGLRDVTKHSGPEKAMTVKDAINWAGIVIVVTPAANAVAAVKDYAGALKGKILVDATNSIGFDANGPFLTGESIAYEMAKAVPDAKVVKAFNAIGTEYMADPKITGSPIQVLMASDHADAKQVLGHVIEHAKFKPQDMGPLKFATALENVALLWVHLRVIEQKKPNFILTTL